MKSKLHSIMDTNKKRGLAMICGITVVATTIFSGSVLAASATLIGAEKAKSIALSHAKITPATQAIFTSTRLKRENGRLVYDIEFYRGNTEYDYDIDAVSGTIRKFDMDIENFSIPSTSGTVATSQSSTGAYIGTAKAKSIALSSAKLSESQTRQMRVQLDHENGRMVYEVDFMSGFLEYEYDIDAVSGAIVKSFVEYDD